MTYKRPIKRNRNNTMRARATTRKNMRKRNSYRYSGRGGFIDNIRAGITTATQVANSGLSSVAAGITNSTAFNKLGKVTDVIYDNKDKANSAKKVVDKAAKKVESIQAKLAELQDKKDKLTQELNKAVAEHMDAKSKYATALNKLEPAPAPAPAPRPVPAPRPAPAPRPPAPRPVPAPRPAPAPRPPAPTMKSQPSFNRTKYGR